MSVQQTANNYLKLAEELERQRASIAVWQRVASIADSQTPDNSISAEQYASVHEFYIHMKLPKHAFGFYQDLAETSFANALVSIELAPPAAQLNALNELIPLVKEIKTNTNKDLHDDQINFYTEMLNHLGSRLAPSNQAIVFDWMIHNAITKQSGELREFITTPYFGLDNFTRPYADEVKAEIGKKLLTTSYNDDRTFNYKDNVLSWFTTFVGNKHPRCIAAVNILNETGFTSPQEAWVVPSAEGKDKVLIVKPYDAQSSTDIPNLLRDFRSLIASAPSTDLKDIRNTVSILTEEFSKHAVALDNEPAKKAAVTKALIELSRFNI